MMKNTILLTLTSFTLTACMNTTTAIINDNIINDKDKTIDLSQNTSWSCEAGDIQTSCPIIGDKVAVLNTNIGDIYYKMLPNQAPEMVKNWETLANKGYYDGIIFHRVIKGFMIQGGDPTGTGTGGSSYTGENLADELSPIFSYNAGTVAMANRGPNTNGSQFFIMHKKYPLPPLYSIFGQVFDGQNIVDKIANTPTGAADRPLKDIIIEKARVYKVSNLR